MAIEPHNNSKLLQELLDKLNEQSGNSNHEELQGLLGGDNSGHFHMTAEQLHALDNLIAGANNHENLSGLLGGDASGHYHLKLSELNKLMNLPDFNSLNHEHLQGLLGGNSSGHYHLTVDLLNKLINLPAGGDSGSGSSKLRLVRQVFEAQITAATDNNKGIGSLSTAQSFSIPAGTDYIFVSGCGGGGGATISGFSTSRDGRGLVAGWTAAQCFNVMYKVQEDDQISVYPGRAGCDAQYIGEKKYGSRGEDSIVWINGVEKVRLAGGNRGGDSFNAGNQTGESKIGGYVSGHDFVFIHASFCNDRLRSHFRTFKNLTITSNNLTDFEDYVLSIINGASSPPSLFGPFGIGGTSLSDYAGIAHNRGIIIIEYLEQVNS